MVLSLIRYKLASRAFRKQAISTGGVRFIAANEWETCPEWDALEKAWEDLTKGRPRLERFLSQPWVYRWIS